MKYKIAIFIVALLVVAVLPWAFACAPKAAPAAAPAFITYWTMSDLSGPYATIQAPLRPALADMQDYVNTKLGGINGVPLKCDVKDHGGKVDTALAQYEELRAMKPKPVILSGWVTPINEALKDRVTEDKIPFVSSPSAKLLYPVGYSFAFDASYADQFGAFMDWLLENWKEKNAPKVAILTWDTGYGRGCVTDECYAYAKAKGIDIVATEVFPINSLDVTTQLLRIKDKNPDWIYGNSLSQGPVAILKSADAMGYKIKFANGYGLGGDAIALGGAKLFEGVITPRSLATWDDVNNSAVKKMIAIADANNREPKLRDTTYAITTATTLVVAEVLKKAVEAVGWEQLNGEAVYNQLIKLKDFAPLGGMNYWNFTQDIRNTRKAYIAQIQGGKILPITGWREIPDLRPGGSYTPKK